MILCQNRLIRHFRAASATVPERCVRPADIGCGTGWIFRGMARRGVFVEAGESLYYMDEAALAVFLRERRVRMSIGAAVLAFLFLFFWLASRA